MTAKEIERRLAARGNPEAAAVAGRFFKTGKGEYGAGDEFIGVRVPDIRAVCKQCADVSLAETQKLLDSPIHEYRLAAVIILANRYPKAPPKEQQEIFDVYLKNLYGGRINNWDLIDVTVEYVIGAHLESTDRKLLYELAASSDVWCKRAAIMSAFCYLKRGDPSTTLELAALLLHDSHDLIQKAVGWQLREVGKRVDRALLLQFLDDHAATMPRTALRYAIEHLTPAQKQHYMHLGRKV